MAEPTNTPFPPSTPNPASTPRAASPVSPSILRSPATTRPLTGLKPVILHIGDPIRYNPDTYAQFENQCDIIRPSTAERQRDEFKRALTEHRWGDFDAIFRPFWGTGGEMGQWDDELIALLPNSVKVFASAGAGFDWADTKLLGERGIIYCNAGLAAADAVADFALAMIISTFRHLPWCIAAAGAASPAAFQDCHERATAVSHTLRRQVLGLIGLGNIGHAIAARAAFGFGMTIHYHDVYRKDSALETKLGATFHADLDDLLRVSDCVVLCAPYAGQHIITAASLQHFKPGSRFVNVARGSLVDEPALADALEAGLLSSVALDVHASEPGVHPRLAAMAGSKTLLTCHNAGGTVETHAGFEELSMRNIMAVLGGGEAITPVNLQYLRK
ncbi:hypothetical protein ACHAQH_002304 [Verticillium albo-atrum]